MHVYLSMVWGACCCVLMIYYQGGPHFQEAGYIFQELIDKFGPSLALLNGKTAVNGRELYGGMNELQLYSRWVRFHRVEGVVTEKCARRRQMVISLVGQ